MGEGLDVTLRSEADAARKARERAISAKYELDHEKLELTHYIPPGPVSQRFILDDFGSPIIMGPVGSGKTTACAFKRIRAARLMPPDRNNLRRCRWIVVRDTFRTAEKTVLTSWKEWFQKGYPGSDWTGGNDRPVVHTLRFRCDDDTIVEAITEFIGLNGQTVEQRLRGYEISGAWLNEADTMDEAGLTYLEQRTGRYPPLRDMPSGVEPHKQVIGDMNAPNEDNYTFEAYVENPAPGRTLYCQPSGRSADAENLENLRTDYYQRIIDTEEDWYVRRFVDNEFGYSRDGKPVYSRFDRQKHVANGPLQPVAGLPLLIGMDAGLHPAAIFAQPMPSGQLRLLDEVVPGQGYGPERFGVLVKQRIEMRYPLVSTISAWADPSTMYGADREGGQLAWIETMGHILGIPVQVPAGGSNEIVLRIKAVSEELKPDLDAKVPQILICPTLKQLIRGFASKYRYKKRNDGSYDVEPEKNDASHVHDALQYLVLGFRGRLAAITGNIAQRSHGGWSAPIAPRMSGQPQEDRWGRPRVQKGSFDRTMPLDRGFDVGRY